MLKQRLNEDGKIEVGLDEAGRGSFLGPLVAGAVVWPEESKWTEEHLKIAPHIRDSKKIAPKKRVKLAEDIKRLATSWAAGFVSATEIDEYGVTWGNQEAFRRALGDITCPYDNVVLDGTMSVPGLLNQRSIIDGDALYLHVAAASIIAKTEHDKWIEQFCQENPQCSEKYDLLNNKGYGTAKHILGLRTYGYTIHHRCTFIHNHVNTGFIRLPHPVKDQPQTEVCLIRLTLAKAI